MEPAFLTYLGNLGVKKDYQLWQIYLTRKLNLSSVLGSVNVIIALFTFWMVGYTDSITELVVVLVLAPLVFYLNMKWGYIAAAYLFTFIGCFLFYFLAVKMGQESYAFLYYSPLIIGLLQMLGRKETFVHLISMFMMCLVSILLVFVSYHFGIFESRLPLEVVSLVKYINIFFSFFTSMAFMVIISSESIKQEQQLKTALQQKEVLLAELFHRVKNNLNIVSSLLNLKKESVDSEAAKNALEECRNLIFSMSLVHNKIYNRNGIENLDFGEYIKDLAQELINTMGGKGTTSLEVKAGNMFLNISQAIPCGLILNELVTNTFKHGKVERSKLTIQIELIEKDGLVQMFYKDNGNGLSKEDSQKKTLGMDLIKSLTEQLNGECAFGSDQGFEFRLKFNN